MKVFKVINPGIQTTVQDLGRSGLMKYGIPPSGAMDQRSFVIGNLLLRNPENAAALEITLQGLNKEISKGSQILVSDVRDKQMSGRMGDDQVRFTLHESHLGGYPAGPIDGHFIRAYPDRISEIRFAEIAYPYFRGISHVNRGPVDC